MGDIAGNANRAGNATNLIGALAPLLLGSGKNTTKGSTNNLGGAVTNNLTGIVTGKDYSKQSAQSDAQSAMQSAMQILLQSGMPEISNYRNNSGIYNDTTSQLLTNDLQARVAREGANVETQRIGQYGDIRANAANTLKGAQTSSVTSEKQNPIVNPMMTLGLLAGGTLLNSLINNGKGDDASKKKGNLTVGDNTSTANPGAGFDLSSLFSGLFDSNAKALGGSSASSSASSGTAGNNAMDFWGVGGNALGKVGASFLSNMFGSSPGTTNEAPNAGTASNPGAGTDGYGGNGNPGQSGGGNSIGEFFGSILSTLFG
jgi:hypothetical protein